MNIAVSKDIQQVPLRRIKTDETQTRDSRRSEAVADYEKLIRDGVVMDPALVFLEAETGILWLGAGHHRFEAYDRAGFDSMPCIVRAGGKWEAIEAGLKDNFQHRGVRLSNKDKVCSVKMVLKLRGQMSNTWIGDLCGMRHETVEKYRLQLESTGEIRRFESLQGADGKWHPRKVSKKSAEPSSAGSYFAEEESLRLRAAEELEEDDAADVSFDLPVFRPGEVYVARGKGDSVAKLVPRPSLSHAVVFVYRDDQVLYTMRGLRVDGIQSDIFDLFGFVQTGPWITTRDTKDLPRWLTEGLPEWFPTERQRWALEHHNSEFRKKHGRDPSLGHAEDWLPEDTDLEAYLQNAWREAREEKFQKPAA
jgi:hypothetical protein